MSFAGENCEEYNLRQRGGRADPASIIPADPPEIGQKPMEYEWPLERDDSPAVYQFAAETVRQAVQSSIAFGRLQ